MSMDILAGTGGRLASLSKNAAAPQGKSGEQAGANGDISDPAKLFGALLEKPQSKEIDTSEQKDESDTQEAEAAIDPSRQSSVYSVSQNLFSFAANLSAVNEGHSASTAEVDSKTAAVVAVADTSEDGLNAKAVDAELSDLSPDAENKPVAAAALDKKNAATIDAKTGNKLEAAAASSVPKPDNASVEPANAQEEVAIAKQPADGGNVHDRMAMQPQQPSRGNAPVEVKADAFAPQASVRINDIQLISERSFGAVKTLQIRLDPVELGAVTARIRVVADNIEVHLIADKAHGAEALAADRSMIEKALKIAGVTEDSKITVTVAERGVVHAQQSTSSQSAGHQQPGSQQQGQHGFDMQSGTDGRNGSQGQSQAQFMGGEGRQNGESADTRRGASDTHGQNGEAIQDTSAFASGRNRGLVV